MDFGLHPVTESKRETRREALHEFRLVDAGAGVLNPGAVKMENRRKLKYQL